MALGNIIFGNSRGSFSIERGCGFEEELTRLFEAYDPNRDNSWREYGTEFENETFSVFPYYWGDCTCGFNCHTFKEPHINCYQNDLESEKLTRGWFRSSHGWLKHPEHWGYFQAQKIENAIMKTLCKKHSLPFPHGCMVHCTCDFDKRYENWLNEIGYPEEHTKDCLLLRPNFLYKSSGLEIQWYKYPLRDSYSNRKITLAEFSEVIDNCIKSLSIR